MRAARRADHPRVNELFHVQTGVNLEGGLKEMFILGLQTDCFERRYTAALAIISAAYSYSMMPASERQRVDTKVYENLSGTLVGSSPFEFQRLFPSPLRAACRALAMADLNIPPAIEGEKWKLPKSKRWLGVPSSAPFKLFRHYKAGKEARKQAQHYLEAKGVDVQSLG